jgi:hypothetical protein
MMTMTAVVMMLVTLLLHASLQHLLLRFQGSSWKLLPNHHGHVLSVADVCCST